MELLSRLLKIFLSLLRTTPGVGSLEMAESSQKPRENYVVAAACVCACVHVVGLGANINKEISYFFPYFSELNLFGGLFGQHTN